MQLNAKKEISWFSDGIEKKSVEYSDQALIKIIKNLSKIIIGFSTISMWFSQDDEIHGSIAIDIGEKECKLNNHKTIYVFEINLMEENFSDYVREGQRLKKLLKKNFKSQTVTSNFR